MSTSVDEHNKFNTFTLDELISGLVYANNLTITNVKQDALRPASEATVVQNGMVTGVPEQWTFAELAMTLAEARLQSADLEMTRAQAALHRVKVARALSDAAASSAKAAQQAADDALAAEAEAADNNHPDAEVRSAKAVDALNLTHAVAAVAEVHAAAAETAEAAAATTIKEIRPSTRKSFIATLAPDYAHLAGEMEVDPTGKHPPKPSFSGVPVDIVGFVCTNCRSYNLVRSGTKKQWYAVTRGFQVGVVFGSRRAKNLTHGVRGHACEGFATLEEAEVYYADSLLKGTVSIVPRF